MAVSFFCPLHSVNLLHHVIPRARVPLIFKPVGAAISFWCRIHLWFRLMGGLQAKSMTSHRNRAVKDGGYVLLWQRYDNNKMADMCYHGNDDVILHLQQYSHRLNLFSCYVIYLGLARGQWWHRNPFYNIYDLDSVGASFDPQPWTACLCYCSHNALALTIR